MSDDDLDLDDDGILTDEEVLVPPVEVRVPSEWTSKMSTKTLSSVPPLPLNELLDESYSAHLCVLSPGTRAPKWCT